MSDAKAASAPAPAANGAAPAAAAAAAPAPSAAAPAAAPVKIVLELPFECKPLTPELKGLVTAAPAALTAPDTTGAVTPALLTSWAVANRRRCCRAFLRSPAPPVSLVHDLLLAARNSVSSQNNQPWGVCVVGGAMRDKLVTALETAFDAWEGAPKLEYPNRPAQLQPRHAAYQAEWAPKYHAALGGAGRDDVKTRKAIDRKNYSFFGAPYNLIVHAPANAAQGTFLDMGCFLGTLLALCEAAGLGACPQFSLAKFSAVIRDTIGLSTERLVMCGFSLGYPDAAADINKFKANKAALSEFVTWHGAEPSAPAPVPAPAAAAPAAPAAAK